jgi:hypothetical protein
VADLSRLDRPSVQHALLALVGLAAGLRHLHGGLNEWGGDNTTFLVLAGALRDGLGYVDAQMPYDPPHLRYPPGFPALLAVLQALGASLVAIKLVLYLAALGGLHLVLTLLRRHRPPRLALGAVLATAVSGVFLDPALSVLSDGVYLLLASGALLLADRAFGDPGASLRVGLLAGVLVGAATLMRMVGVALGPGLLLAALLARGRPPRARLAQLAAAGAAALLVTAPWFLVLVTAGESSPYLEQLARTGPGAAVPAAPDEAAAQAPGAAGAPEGEADEADDAGDADDADDAGAGAARGARRAGAGRPPREARGISGGGSSVLARPYLNVEDLVLRAYHMPLPGPIASASPGAQRVVRTGFAAAVLCAGLVALLGALLGLARRRAVEDATALVYLLVLGFWVGGGPRLLVPVLPFLMLWVVDGARQVVVLGARVLRRPAPGAASLARLDLASIGLLLLLQLGVTELSPGLRLRLDGSRSRWWGDYLTVLDRLGELAAPGDLVFSQPAAVPYLLHGLESVGLPRDLRRPERVLARLEREGAAWVVDSPFLYHEYRGRLGRTFRAYPERFELRAQRGDVRLYRFRPAEAD